MPTDPSVHVDHALLAEFRAGKRFALFLGTYRVTAPIGSTTPPKQRPSPNACCARSLRRFGSVSTLSK